MPSPKYHQQNFVKEFKSEKLCSFHQNNKISGEPLQEYVGECSIEGFEWWWYDNTEEGNKKWGGWECGGEWDNGEGKGRKRNGR